MGRVRRKDLVRRPSGRDRIYESELSQLSLKIGFRCWYCGIPLARSRGLGFAKTDGMSVSIDHIKPKCRGGNEEIRNKALACVRCNRAKNNSSLPEFLQWLAHIRSSKFSCFIMSRTQHSLTPLEFDLLRKD